MPSGTVRPSSWCCAQPHGVLRAIPEHHWDSHSVNFTKLNVVLLRLLGIADTQAHPTARPYAPSAAPRYAQHMRQKSNALVSAVIRTTAQWNAICSPTRVLIIEHLDACGPMSAREIADRIGKSPELVHHHLPTLLRAGIIRDHAVRSRGRRKERVFELPPGRWSFDFKSDPALAARGMARLARTWARYTERMLARRLQKGEGITDSFARLVTIRSETGPLRPRAARAVRAHLRAIMEIFEAERERGDGPPHLINWAFFPCHDPSAAEQPPTPPPHATRTNRPRHASK